MRRKHQKFRSNRNNYTPAYMNKLRRKPTVKADNNGVRKDCLTPRIQFSLVSGLCLWSCNRGGVIILTRNLGHSIDFCCTTLEPCLKLSN